MNQQSCFIMWKLTVSICALMVLFVGCRPKKPLTEFCSCYCKGTGNDGNAYSKEMTFNPSIAGGSCAQNTKGCHYQTPDGIQVSGTFSNCLKCSDKGCVSPSTTSTEEPTPTP
jgi:hypothetical protein